MDKVCVLLEGGEGHIEFRGLGSEVECKAAMRSIIHHKWHKPVSTNFVILEIASGTFQDPENPWKHPGTVLNQYDGYGKPKSR